MSKFLHADETTASADDEYKDDAQAIAIPRVFL